MYIIFILHSYRFILAILAIPFIQILIPHFVFGGLPKELKIGFVDEEISIHDCNNSYSTGCILSDENFRLSCIYVDLFSK